MKRFMFLLTIITFFAAKGRADVVQFKNGDRLSGDIVRIQDGNIYLKSQVAGDVTIPIKEVAEYTASGPSVLLTKSQQEARGTLQLLPSGDWQVQTASGKEVIEAKNVAIIYPAKTFDAGGYGQKHKLWHDWTGKGALGFSQVKGDQTSRTFSMNVDAVRRMPILPELPESSRTNFFLTTLFAKSQDLQGSHVSTNNISSGVRQDFKITDNNFWFLLGQLDHSSTQSLDLRQTYGAGLGRDVIHRPSMDFQAIGGLTFVKEHFQGGVYNQNAEALAGEKLSWKLTPWLILDHALSIYPTVTGGAHFRLDSTTGLSTKITKRWSFNTSYTDHYLSNPLPGHTKNEVIITTGVGVSF